MVKRVEILVYLQYKAATIESFKEIGVSVEYVNKKAGYAVCYCDESLTKKFINLLHHTKGIKKFEFSPTELVQLDI